MPWKSPVALLAVAVILGAAGVALAPAASADPDVAGTYNPLPAERIVNTITGVGVTKAVVGAGKTLSFDGLVGLGDQSVAALDLTITASAPTRNGFLTAYSGSTRPGTTSVLYTAGETTATAAPVSLDGASGTVKIYNGSAGTVQIVVDRSGYWTGGTFPSTDVGLYHPRTPTRVVDSRTTGTPIGGRTPVPVPLTTLDLPASATPVVANISAVLPGSNGYLTATADVAATTTGPGTTSVSFNARRSRSNLTVVTRGEDGSFQLFNGSRVAVNYTVDVVGYFTSGQNGDTSQPSGTSSFFQQRFADTRVDGGPLAARDSRVVNVGAPAYVQTITVNITATASTATGYLTAWNGTAARPVGAVTTFAPKLTRTGTVVVPVTDGGFRVYNASAGAVDFVVDIVAFTITHTSADRVERRTTSTSWGHR